MSSLAIQPAQSSIVLPAPRCGAIHVRLATMDDIPFMDDLQKKHQKMLGWTPRATLEGKIRAGHVLIAEEQGASGKGQANAENAAIVSSSSSLAPCPSHLAPVPVGYVISQDRYMGRDDVGVVYQLNIAPSHQRGLIGATLIKTVFDRAAYGCKLFCCWCAQDIVANYFWESIGFVPLAFRTGNRAKGRTHIFWQKRIRENDTTTPYWFPAETRGGMMNEARLVLPIPPGTHWKDVKPIVLPGLSSTLRLRPEGGGVEGPGGEEATQPALPSPRRAARKVVIAPPPLSEISSGGLRLGAPTPPVVKEKPKRAGPERSRREPRPKAKNDPKHVAAARELRDRWLEQVNATGLLSHGKYDVSRGLDHQSIRLPGSARQPGIPALPAPAAA